MDTSALQAMTQEAAQRMGGKLWPNGLGFDKQGWTYAYSERESIWYATKDGAKAFVTGRGATPEEARQDPNMERRPS